MVRRFFSALLPCVVPALPFLAGCTQDSPSGPGDKDPVKVPASIEIVGALEGAVGENLDLAVVVLDSAGDTLRTGMIGWSSRDTARVGVAPPAAGGGSGGFFVTLRAKRVGAVVVTASLGALRDSVVVNTRLPPFTFVFADTVPEAERNLIRDGIQDAQAFHKLAFEKTLSDSITISGVYAAQGCAQGGAAAFASGRSITFCLGNPGWKTHGPVIKQKIVQHELFHLWQFAYWSADPAKSPTWLVEGSAELMGYYGVRQRGFVTLETALGCQRKESADFAANQPPGLPPLQNVEARQAFQATVGPLYTHSMLGAHYLVEEGDGLAALETYGNVVKTSATWQAAFQQAFNIAPATFYGAFPGYVSGLPVPATYECRF